MLSQPKPHTSRNTQKLVSINIIECELKHEIETREAKIELIGKAENNLTVPFSRALAESVVKVSEADLLRQRAENEHDRKGHAKNRHAAFLAHARLAHGGARRRGRDQASCEEQIRDDHEEEGHETIEKRVHLVPHRIELVVVGLVARK